jgi:hypothetical protein
MKKALSTFLLLTLLLPGFGQIANYISTIGGTGQDHARTVEALSDGYLIAGSSTSFSAQTSDIYLFKVDLLGNVKWSKLIGGLGSEEITTSVRTADKHFILAGYSTSYTGTGMDADNIIVLKVDSLGNILWSKIYGGMQTDRVLTVREAANQDILLSGYTQSIGAGGKDMLLVRLSSSGTLKWFNAYGSTDDETANSLCELGNGDIVLTGSTTASGGGAQQIVGLKTDANGTLIWQHLYNPSLYSTQMARWGSDVIALSDQNILFAGQLGNGSIGDAEPFQMETDTSGQVIWIHSYTINSGPCGANRVMETSTGFAMYACMQTMPVLLTTDASGFTTICQGYQEAGYATKGNVGNMVCRAGNGYCIVMDATKAGSSKAMMMNTDLNGTGVCGLYSPLGGGNPSSPTVAVTPLSYVGVSGGSQSVVNPRDTSVTSILYTLCSSNSILESTVKNEISFYPNPCSDLLWVKDETGRGAILFRITDLSGREMLNQTLTQSDRTLNMSELSPGLYLFTAVNSEGRCGFGKIQVMR